MKYTKLVLSAATLLALPLLTTGCSTSFSPTASSAPQARSMSPLSGRAMGGQQPISGSAIYLMGAGSGDNVTGYGSAALPLLSGSGVQADANGNTFVLTDTNGRFDITGLYTCAYGNTQPVYLVAAGGDAGSGSNSAIMLFLALGQCGNLSSQSFISINELSTVVGVTALQQFIGADAFHVGSSTGNLNGITNAMAMANNLVNMNYGYVVASSTKADGSALVTNPTAKIYTLADAMAACVNSSGVNDAGCSGTGSTPNSGFLIAGNYTPNVAQATNVSDTFAAMLQIARYPAYNPQIIINTVPPQSAFGGALNTAPNDYALPVSYHGGGLGGPYPNNLVSATAVAVDSFGSVWIAACGVSCQGIPPDSLIEINPYTGSYSNGYILSGNGGFGVGSVHNTQSIAIDTSNNVYSVNDVTPGATAGSHSALSSVTILAEGGTEYNSSPVENGGNFAMLEGIAIDYAGHVYVTDFGSGSGGSIYSVTQGGTVTTILNSGQGAFAPLVGPTGIALETASNGGYIVSDTGGSLTAIYKPGSGSLYTQTETQASGAHPTAVVVSSSANIWSLNPAFSTTPPTMYKLSEATGALVPCNGGQGRANCQAMGGSSTVVIPNAVNAQVLAIDGTGEVLVPACSAGCSSTSTVPDSIAIFNNIGAKVTNRTGLQDDSLANPVGIAVDGSGNAWVTSGNTGSVTEFVGIAVPVATPLAQALNNGPGLKP